MKASVHDVPAEFLLPSESVPRLLSSWCRRIDSRLTWFWPAHAPEKDWRWVYVARRPLDGVLKLGISSSPMARVQGLKFSGSGGFEPLALIPYCGLEHERVLHRALAPFAAPTGREWFVDCPETRAFAWCARSLRRSLGSRLKRQISPEADRAARDAAIAEIGRLIDAGANRIFATGSAPEGDGEMSVHVIGDLSPEPTVVTVKGA